MLIRFIHSYFASFRFGIGAVIGGVATVASAAIGASSSSGSSSANDAAANAQDVQSQIAADEWNTYKQTYLPLEQTMVQDAQNYASPANYEKAAGDAKSTVESQFDAQKASLARTPGMDPSSGAYQAGMTSLGLQEAASSATAQNAARTNVTNTAFDRELNAVSLGKGLPATASSAASSAANTALGLSNLEYNQSNKDAANTGAMISGLGNVANGVANWATSGSNSSSGYNFNSGFSTPDQSYGVSTPAGLSGVGYNVSTWSNN